MKNRNILFIVEGSNDEPKFICRLFDVCNMGSFNTYSYNTNIHVLANHLRIDYPDFDEDVTDLLAILRSYESNPDKLKILNKEYTDIFLIFDLDPQDHMINFTMIKRMLDYYIDSTNQGKLFINYPMMQSYKHFKILPDDNFKNLRINLEQCRSYKYMVEEYSKYTNVDVYDYITFVSLAVHHLRKANYILNGVYSETSMEEYLKMNSSLIYDKQISLLKDLNCIYVLNTCIFKTIAVKKSSFLI